MLVARGEDKSTVVQQRFFECQIIISVGKNVEASHLEIYGCDKNGLVQLVTWSNELEPIKILSSSQCTLWGKNMNEDLKIEINYQGESAQIKLNATLAMDDMSADQS